MSGIVGIVSEKDCVNDLYYITDFHSHLGKKIGGMAVCDGKGISNQIKDISIYPFRPELDKFVNETFGKKGIGVIGDYEPQPLIIGSKLKKEGYALAHVGKINNLEDLTAEAYKRKSHFNEMSLGKVNPTEVVSSLINQGDDFKEGIKFMQNRVQGSSSIVLLTNECVYVARDKYGRTPINVGEKQGSIAVSFESFPLESLGFELTNYLGPGEIGRITESGYERLKEPEDLLQLCSFLLVYYGNSGTIYEGVTSEDFRNNLGIKLAKRDQDLSIEGFNPDFAGGIPDSGIGSGLGYASGSGLPFRRPFIKYTETWQRSFMPQDQKIRNFVAKMKLIPIQSLIRGKEVVLCDDSLVRGTQSKNKFEILQRLGVKRSHFRLSCPPLVFPCNFLNFSMSKSVFDLATRRTIKEIEGKDEVDLSDYINYNSDKYVEMVERMRKSIGVDSLRFQKLDDLVSISGLPKKNLCTYCWDGCDSTLCS